jgi:hypothetical protein
VSALSNAIAWATAHGGLPAWCAVLVALAMLGVAFANFLVSLATYRKKYPFKKHLDVKRKPLFSRQKHAFKAPEIQITLKNREYLDVMSDLSRHATRLTFKKIQVFS